MGNRSNMATSLIVPVLRSKHLVGKGEMPPEGDRAKSEDLWNLVNYVRAFAKNKVTQSCNFHNGSGLKVPRPLCDPWVWKSVVF